MIMRKLVSFMAKRKSKKIDRVLEYTFEESEKTLMRILTRHQDTVLGQKHGFADIHSPERFREEVPLVDSTKMEKYVRMTYDRPQGVMTADPVVWYLQTSGTTGKPKKLPTTQQGLKDVAKGTMLGWMGFLNQDEDNPRIVDGTLVTFGAPAVMDHINGVPVGYATGVYARHQNPLFQRLIEPGEEIFNIMNMELKMWEYAKLVATSDVTAFQGITTLSLALIRRLQDMYGPMLLDEFKGTKHERRIRRALSDDGKLDVAVLCPDVRLFLASGIDTEPYHEWLKKTLPDATIWEVYGGSEGFYGAQLLPGVGVQLSPQINYYEFIHEDELDNPVPEVIPLSDVKRGHRYEMVLTNNIGWYRYRTGDLMTFTSTDPYTIRNIARKGRVVNLSGEKLSEAHVSDALQQACRKTGANVMDYSVVGEVNNGLAFYTLAAMFKALDFDPVEFIHQFENAICASNQEFKFNRETGALAPTRLMRMTSSAYENKVKTTHVQAKPVPLTTDTTVLETCEVI
jgi:hypothetical protein